MVGFHNLAFLWQIFPVSDGISTKNIRYKKHQSWKR